MLITVETTCLHVFILTSIKVIKNDEICVEVAFLPHKHLTMTDQTASRPTPFGIEMVDSVEGFKLKLKEHTIRSPKSESNIGVVLNQLTIRIRILVIK